MGLLRDIDKVLAAIVGIALLTLILNRASRADEVINDAGTVFTGLLQTMTLTGQHGATGSW